MGCKGLHKAFQSLFRLWLQAAFHQYNVTYVYPKNST